jgi:arylsulfatase A-like enzyme
MSTAHGLERASILNAGMVCLFLLMPLGVSANEIKSRSNILILMADDWNWPQSVGVKDPNIRLSTYDRLVREGVRFNNAFVAAQSCTPSRASMLTGMHPWQLETGVNLWSALPARFKTYADFLEESAARTGAGAPCCTRGET